MLLKRFSKVLFIALYLLKRSKATALPRKQPTLCRRVETAPLRYIYLLRSKVFLVNPQLSANIL